MFHSLEFWARFLLVNIPSYLLASSPEFDRVCSVIQAYLLLQVVALCWAFLVNSALALASEWAAFLPISSNVNGSNTIHLVLAFYVSYASFRVVISFAQSVSHSALESMKDFPEAARVLSSAGKFTLYLSPIIFIPTFLLEFGLIYSDKLCNINKNEYLQIICHNSGLYFLSSAYPEVQRLVFYSITVMVIQLWQVLLNQFPRWDDIFRQIPVFTRIILRLGAMILFFLTLFGIFLGAYSYFKSKNNNNTRLMQYSNYGWPILTISLFGWTLWLVIFMPSLLRVQGQQWAQRVSPAALQQLAIQLRISLVSILSISFCIECAFVGLPQAQLDLTVATIAIPALFVSVYLLAAGAIQVLIYV